MLAPVISRCRRQLPAQRYPEARSVSEKRSFCRNTLAWIKQRSREKEVDDNGRAIETGVQALTVDSTRERNRLPVRVLPSSLPASYHSSHRSVEVKTRVDNSNLNSHQDPQHPTPSYTAPP
jgi:hypothetical protein